MSQKQNTWTFSFPAAEKEILENLALEFGCVWGDKPNISRMLRDIAAGKIKLSLAEGSPIDVRRLTAVAKIQEGIEMLLK